MNMTVRLYTEAELDRLRSMPKRVTNPRARWSTKPQVAPIHKQRRFQAVGERDGEARFSVYQRQSLDDPTDFSCGIAYRPPGGSFLTLARYNGSNHSHGDIALRPHIHRATEKAITAGRKPEWEAAETDRYVTLDGAMACLIDDFKIAGIIAKPEPPRLL